MDDPLPAQPSFTNAASQAVQATKQHVEHAWQHVKTFMQTRSITFWIVFSVAILTLLGVIIYYVCTYYYLWYRYIAGGGSYHRYLFINADIVDRRPVDYHYLTQPTNGYTYSMWLYVANWYSNQSFDKWKVVYCRAAEDELVKSKCPNLKPTWNTVPDQQPGIWLGNTRNFLRVVVTTQAKVNGCGSGSAFNDGTASCINIINNEPQTETIGGTSLLEYADLTDIPIGKWFHLVVVVSPQRMELYLDGQLVVTHVFLGSCDFTTCDPNNGYFAPNVRYQARLTNFRYMPLALPVQMVRVLHDAELANPVLDISNPLDPTSSYDRDVGEVLNAWW